MPARLDQVRDREDDLVLEDRLHVEVLLREVRATSPRSSSPDANRRIDSWISSIGFGLRPDIGSWAGAARSRPSPIRIDFGPFGA